MNEDKKPLIIAAIPAYNEEKTIAKIILLAQKQADRVIVCDDGSTDCTAEIAENLGAHVTRHDKNYGYGAALQSLFRGVREMGADVMVTLDGDGQHNPAEIPRLVKPVLEGKADIAIGSRFLGEVEKRSSVPRFRRLGIKVITKLTGAASNYGLSDAQCGFRAYGRKALECLSLYENGMGLSVEVLLNARKRGLTVAEVPVGCNYHGLEKTSSQDSFSHGMSVISSIARLVVEERPLLFLGAPGVASLLLGVILGLWMLQVYVSEHYIVTNIALASMAFTLIGLFAIFTAITLYAISRQMQKK